MASRSPTAATPVTMAASRPTPHNSPASLPTFSGDDTHKPVSSNCGLVTSSVRASLPTFPVPTCATRIAIFSLRPLNAHELFQTLVHYFRRCSCGIIVTLMGPREDVHFTSGDDRISAWLYRPEGSGPAPLLVMAHGLGAVRTMRLDAYAERFSAAGYGCLVFDYRHFGDSDGQPRQVLDIDMQLADWAAAVGYARTLDGI